jgi:hypothetical protein
MDGLYFSGVKKVAREEGYYEEDDEDGQGPGCEYLFLASFWLLCIGALESGREKEGGSGLTIGVCVDDISLCVRRDMLESALFFPYLQPCAVRSAQCIVRAGYILSIWPMAHHPTTEAMMGSPLQYHQQSPSPMCAKR